jgi:hypothetical protein
MFLLFKRTCAGNSILVQFKQVELSKQMKRQQTVCASETITALSGVVVMLLFATSAFGGCPADNTVARRNSIAQANGAKMRYENWFNNYHESFVYKIFLKSKINGQPFTTLEEAAEIIRRVNDFTGGMHQIVYLAGWQYDGHDSKYPSLDMVGDHCKSRFGESPLESLRGMMREARKFNADVSLHINVDDAYTNSPLWKSYVDDNLLCRDGNGNLVKSGVWDGELAYAVSHQKEWKSGRLERRILGLLDLIPEIRQSHTIHIDAIIGRESKFDGVSLADDKAAIRNMVDFWHEQGVDVTTEFLQSMDALGLFPMVYHHNTDESQRILYPPSLLCGGDSAWNTRHLLDYDNQKWESFRPSGGCAYEEAWGDGHWGDLTGAALADERKFLANLFNRAILNAYYNRSRPVRHSVTADEYIVERANGVTATVFRKDRTLAVVDNGRTVVSKCDFFLDFPYGGGTILAYSEHGCNREFRLPSSFASEKALSLTVWPCGKTDKLDVNCGKVQLVLENGMSALIRKLR